MSNLRPNHLTNGRLILRPLSKDDKPLFVTLYSDNECMKFIGEPVERGQAARNFYHALVQWENHEPRFLYWSITDRDSNEQIGVIALIFDPSDRSQAEIGMILTEATQGRGFSKLAMASVAHHAFSLKLVTHIRARHRTNHVAAQRLVQRLGYARVRVDENDYSHWVISPEDMRIPTEESGLAHGR